MPIDVLIAMGLSIDQKKNKKKTSEFKAESEIDEKKNDFKAKKKNWEKTKKNN